MGRRVRSEGDYSVWNPFVEWLVDRLSEVLVGMVPVNSPLVASTRLGAQRHQLNDPPISLFASGRASF